MPLVLTPSFWVLCTIALFGFVLVNLSRRARLRADLDRLPVLNPSAGSKDKQQSALTGHELYLAGYQKFKDEAYRILTPDDVEDVVIPVKFLPELAVLPESDLRIYPALAKILESKYTGVTTDLASVAHMLRNELTPALDRLNPIIFDEVGRIMKHMMPECQDWTPMPMFSTASRMVAQLTGRMFVGEDLCRSPEYLDMAVNYTLDVTPAVSDVKRMKPLLRPFLARRLASVRRLREREAAAARMLEPLVQTRLDAERRAEKDPDRSPPDDMISVLVRMSERRGIVSATEIAKVQLGIIFSAVQATSKAMTNSMYDLAVRPEYMEPLRQEIRTVLAAHGGEMTTRAMQQMVKLDSFIKESERLSPAVVAAFNREVGPRGLTLPNGQHVPAGVTVHVALRAHLTDPEGYGNDEAPANEFDGLRHYRRRTRPGASAADQARSQFVTSHANYVAFGYGRHACPGRFFVATELKMMLAHLIIMFDFKNADGSMERYSCKEAGPFLRPDEHKNLLFKRVKGQHGMLPTHG